MVKRKNLVTLRSVDKDAYDKLHHAVREVRSDIKAMDNPSASAENRAIAIVSILDDLERFADAFANASNSYKEFTGEYFTESVISGLKYRKVRINLSLRLFRLMKDICPDL